MALLTNYMSFFVSPFGEKSVTDEVNAFLRSHRIINVEKRLIDVRRVFMMKISRQGAEAPRTQSAIKNSYTPKSKKAAERGIFDD